MLKEIHEQPALLEQLTRKGFVVPVSLVDSPFCTMLGCGSAFYAAWIGKMYMERIAGRFTQLELASEFHYRQPRILPGATFVVSQSGETADSLKAAQYAKAQGQYLVGMVNVDHSAIARLVDHLVLTSAGPEVGVASTKAFMSQVFCFLRLAMAMSPHEALKQQLTKALEDLPQAMQYVLLRAPQIQSLARRLVSAHSIIYLGRGIHFPVVLEGALKMMELSYIHAQGFAAGELKHGPLALIDASVPVIVLAPYDETFEKTLSNIHEVCARGAQVFVITDERGQAELGKLALQEVFAFSNLGHPLLSPFVSTLVFQLLAYHTALQKGCSIDQPRNLSKSVTVE
jgi:glucosamine--fructose-6-phosphate aminotransferase (isomerizing)